MKLSVSRRTDVVCVAVAWYGNGWMENIPIPTRVYLVVFQYTLIPITQIDEKTNFRIYTYSSFF
jgi:hypothetical protein